MLRTLSILICAFGLLSGVRAEAAADSAEKARAVLEKYCYQCHGIAFKHPDLDVLKPKVLIDMGLVVPGKPEESQLWDAAGVDRRMPPGNTRKPSDDELKLLYEWIAAGATEFPEEEVRKPVTVNDVLGSILDDLNRLGREDQRYQRYFTLINLHNNSFRERANTTKRQNVSAVELKITRAALSKALNSVSWQHRIVIPAAIDAQQTVLRIDLRDLGWERGTTWNDILREYPYALKLDLHPEPNVRGMASEVYAKTGTDVPYLRADWFIASAVRPPLYYRILGLPDHALDLERMLKVDVIADFMRDRVARAGFTESGVSQQNRLVDRHDAVHGVYWKSYDFAPNREHGNLLSFPLGPVFADNPFAGQAFQHDGGEMIFSLPNGLHGYYLTDGVGKSIDEGPTAVVRDSNETAGSPAVVVGISCMGCHKTGMISFTDAVRDGTGVGGEARLKVQRLYPEKSRMEQLLQQDEAAYLAAALRATGQFLAGDGAVLAPQEFKEFDDPIKLTAQRYQRDMGLEEVAAELNLSPENLAILIKTNRRLREFGLGPLVNQEAAAIKRDEWTSSGKLLSTFRRVATEIDAGVPHVQR